MAKRLGGRPVTTRQIKEYRRKKGLEVSREEAIEIWYEKRWGKRKKFPDGFSQNPDHRMYLIQALVEESKKETGEYPIWDEFREKKLGPMVGTYHRNSPYDSFVFAGFTDPNSKYYDEDLAKTPWTVLKKLPQSYWDIKKRRVKATKWLVKKEGGIEKITQDSFEENGLSGLCQLPRYHGYIFNVLKEAYPHSTESDLGRLPTHYWGVGRRRIKAIIDLASEVGRTPYFDDYRKHGLSAVLGYYKSSPIAAAKDAGLEPERKEAHFWENENNFRGELQTEINIYGKFPKSHEIHDSNPALSGAFYTTNRDIRDYRKEYEEKGSLLPI